MTNFALTLLLLSYSFACAAAACTYDVRASTRFSETKVREDIAAEAPSASEATCVASCDAEPTCVSYTFNSAALWCTTSSRLLGATTGTLIADADQTLAFKVSCPGLPSCGYTVTQGLSSGSNTKVLKFLPMPEARCAEICASQERCAFYTYYTHGGYCNVEERGHSKAPNGYYRTGLKNACPNAAREYERREGVGLVFGTDDHIVDDYPLSNESECSGACDASLCVGYVWDEGNGINKTCTTLRATAVPSWGGSVPNKVSAIRKPCLFTEFRYAAGLRRNGTTDSRVLDVDSAENCSALCAERRGCVGFSLDSAGLRPTCSLHSELGAGEMGDAAATTTLAIKMGCVTEITQRVYLDQVKMGGHPTNVPLPVGAQYTRPGDSMTACLILCFRPYYSEDALCRQAAFESAGTCLVYYDGGGAPGPLRGALMTARDG